MSPPVRRDRCGIDAAGLDIRNGIECALHARPAIEAQQDLSARCYAGYGRNDLTNIARAQNVETRQNRAVVIRFPTHKGEDLAGSEGDDTATPVEDALAVLGAKAQPVLDPTLVEDEHDLGHERRHCDAPILSARLGTKLLDRTRSVSVTRRRETDAE